MSFLCETYETSKMMKHGKKLPSMTPVIETNKMYLLKVDDFHCACSGEHHHSQLTRVPFRSCAIYIRCPIVLIKCTRFMGVQFRAVLWCF